MQKLDADPSFGKSLITAVSVIVRVVAFDYEGHGMRQPKPKSLKRDTIAERCMSALSRIVVEGDISEWPSGTTNGAGQMVGFRIQGLVDSTRCTVLTIRTVLQLRRLAWNTSRYAEQLMGLCLHQRKSIPIGAIVYELAE